MAQRGGASGHSLLTCGWLDRLVIGLHCGTGHGRRAREGIGRGRDRGQGEFGDLDEISRFAPAHAIYQRPREIMTKWAHLQHLVTEDAPLDMSGAGARDSITVVGS